MFLVKENGSLIFESFFIEDEKQYHISKSWERGINLALSSDLIFPENTYNDDYLKKLLEKYSLL